MRTKVYFFSGTGNSFAVARDIAEKIGADLIPIPEAMKRGKIYLNAESVGIVFPSYLAPLSGLPLIVERFIHRIVDIDSVHIFTVCTCGGHECFNALPSLNRLRQIIKKCGGTVSAEYSLRLPMNNLDYDHIPIPINKDHEAIIRASKAKVNNICSRITKKEGTKYKAVKNGFNLLMTPVYKLLRGSVIKELRVKAKEPLHTQLNYFELIPLTDKSISVDDSCNGCGICAKVCPVNNIRIVGGKPEFQHRCEMCFACDEWCASTTIHHWSRPKGTKYHHPEVNLSDILYMKENSRITR